MRRVSKHHCFGLGAIVTKHCERDPNELRLYPGAAWRRSWAKATLCAVVLLLGVTEATEVRAFRLPSLSIPRIRIPHISVPHISVPHNSAPHISAPHIATPSVSRWNYRTVHTVPSLHGETASHAVSTGRANEGSHIEERGATRESAPSSATQPSSHIVTSLPPASEAPSHIKSSLPPASEEQAHIKLSLPPPVASGGKVATTEPPDASPQPHIKQSLPPVDDAKAAMATPKDVSCGGDATSNGCTPNAAPISNPPPSVFIGNKPISSSPPAAGLNNPGGDRNVPTPCQDLSGSSGCPNAGGIQLNGPLERGQLQTPQLNQGANSPRLTPGVNPLGPPPLIADVGMPPVGGGLGNTGPGGLGDTAPAVTTNTQTSTATNTQTATGTEPGSGPGNATDAGAPADPKKQQSPQATLACLHFGPPVNEGEYGCPSGQGPQRGVDVRMARIGDNEYDPTLECPKSITLGWKDGDNSPAPIVVTPGRGGGQHVSACSGGPKDWYVRP
jgi:hypothetical protein